MTTWHNRVTQRAFAALLENWPNLEVLADYSQRDPVKTALRIRASFVKAFRGLPGPFVQYVGLQPIRHVEFRQVADRLLEMLSRQRQHAQKED